MSASAELSDLMKASAKGPCGTGEECAEPRSEAPPAPTTSNLSVEAKTTDQEAERPAEIDYAHFQQVDVRLGTIIRAEPNKKARVPAHKLWVDFGKDIGVKQTSAQITQHYAVEESKKNDEAAARKAEKMKAWGAGKKAKASKAADESTAAGREVEEMATDNCKEANAKAGSGDPAQAEQNNPTQSIGPRCQQSLIGKRVLAVINFPSKKIAGFTSEFLLLGCKDANGHVILASPDSGADLSQLENGARLL
eukprot:g7770.t1